jgi:hypothetical protein
MNENLETPKDEKDETNEIVNHVHEHDYTYISSSNGDYKVCRGCGDTILVFSSGC